MKIETIAFAAILVLSAPLPPFGAAESTSTGHAGKHSHQHRHAIYAGSVPFWKKKA
jgi:hypothetical protein